MLGFRKKQPRLSGAQSAVVMRRLSEVERETVGQQPTTSLNRRLPELLEAAS
jgi:hypothetical protein